MRLTTSPQDPSTHSQFLQLIGQPRCVGSAAKCSLFHRDDIAVLDGASKLCNELLVRDQENATRDLAEEEGAVEGRRQGAHVDHQSNVEQEESEEAIVSSVGNSKERLQTSRRVVIGRRDCKF